MVKSAAAACLLVLSTNVLGALVKLTYFASEASGTVGGQPFAGESLQYTVTLDTATGHGPGLVPHQSRYWEVSAVSDLQLQSTMYHFDGLANPVLLARDEGLDSVWVTAFGLRAQFTTPVNEGPLQSILFPDAFVEGFFEAIGKNHPFPIFDRITGTFQSTAGKVIINDSTVEFLRVTFVPAPGSIALALSAAAFTGRRRR